MRLLALHLSPVPPGPPLLCLPEAARLNWPSGHLEARAGESQTNPLAGTPSLGEPQEVRGSPEACPRGPGSPAPLLEMALGDSRFTQLNLGPEDFLPLALMGKMRH